MRWWWCVYVGGCVCKVMLVRWWCVGVLVQVCVREVVRVCTH